MMMMRPNGSQPAGSTIQQVPDEMYESAHDCAICDKKFHAFRRKHRCRSCGNAVCGSCARTHRVMPSTTLMRYNNEPVRVCDTCIRGQNQIMSERRRTEDIERARARQQAALEETERAAAAERVRMEQLAAEELAREATRRLMQRRAVELKHLGPRPDRATLRRCRSLDDCSHMPHATYDSAVVDAEKRAVAIMEEYGGKRDNASAPPLIHQATIAPVAEECAICLDTMDVGNAIYTTACGHSFHFRCLKEIQSSDSSNYDKCPSCRATMEEMQIKKQCDHPRVRLGHRFCRDCGKPVTERDAKPRPAEPTSNGGVTPPTSSTAPTQPTSYRAGSQGALVRCPQCQIQMRVLPHMYNMRVACPSGHMFLVQVAGQMPLYSGGRGGGPGRGSIGGRGGRGAYMQGAQPGYPGTSYYRPTA